MNVNYVSFSRLKYPNQKEYEKAAGQFIMSLIANNQEVTLNPYEGGGGVEIHFYEADPDQYNALWLDEDEREAALHVRRHKLLGKT